MAGPVGAVEFVGGGRPWGYGAAVEEFQDLGDGGELVGSQGEFAQQQGALHQEFGGGRLVEEGPVVDAGEDEAAGGVVVGEQGQGQDGTCGQGAGELGPDALGGQVALQAVHRMRRVLEDQDGLRAPRLPGSAAEAGVGGWSSQSHS